MRRKRIKSLRELMGASEVCFLHEISGGVAAACRIHNRMAGENCGHTPALRSLHLH